MLPKENRLPGYLIPQTLKSGQRFFSSLFTLVVVQSPNKKIQLAIIVPKKINKKAVKRNKIKRRFREAIKASLNLIKPGTRAVFLVKEKAMVARFAAIKAEVKKALDQTGLVFNKNKK